MRVQVLAAIKKWLEVRAQEKRAREEAYNRSCHVKGNLYCPACMFTITSSGAIYHTARDSLFFCQYDIPERAGKVRHRI